MHTALFVKNNKNMLNTDIKAYISLGDDINKSKADGSEETKQGVVSKKLPELTLEMSNEDIIKLTDKWEADWKESPKKTDWEKQIDENEKYWLGKQHDLPKELIDGRPDADNLIFESLETFLPLSTRRNPEPIVSLDNSEKDENGNENPIHSKYILKVKGRLADLADKNKLRLKLKKGARHWAIYQLGVAKFGWDLDKDIPIVRIIRPKRVILDPDATIDEDGYNGDRIGEYRKLPASKILALIGDEQLPEVTEAKKAITDKVGTDTGTSINFIEWWTPQYMCWKLDKTVLFKKKNPHWNYDKTETPSPTDMSSSGVQVDDYGSVTTQETTTKGINHFMTPQMPFSFLSVFNLGDHPMDKTSLIGQNLANQDRINKRNKQIDKNADDMNGGIVVSLGRSGLTQPQAKSVTTALRKGGTVVIPDGVPREAIDRYPTPGLPPDVYNQLADTRSRLRDIFGIRGSSAAGLETEDSVRGKILNRGSDGDRIGGGVTEYLEQFADDIYNWFVQLLYVYDTGFQFIEGATPPKIVVSVKEGSLLPKDSTSIANQSLELAKLNRISNLDLYKRLEYPNPEELAANVWLETNAPHLLYKDNSLIQEAMAMAQSAATEKAATATAEADQSHARDMEKEQLKQSMKQGEGQGAPGRSILSEVPVQ